MRGTFGLPGCESLFAWFRGLFDSLVHQENGSDGLPNGKAPSAKSIYQQNINIYSYKHFKSRVNIIKKDLSQPLNPSVVLIKFLLLTYEV